MTARQFYEAVLTELNKVQAPAVLLEDFNYFGNKAISQYINKMYNLYDINQQKSDDLRVLKSTAVLTPALNTDLASNNLLRNTFEVYLPDDYLHILGCVVEFTAVKKYNCYNIGDVVQFSARRLTADMFPAIMNNYYMRPSYKNPYFYINNINLKNYFSTVDNLIDINTSSMEVDLHTYAKEWQDGKLYKVNDIVKIYDGPDIVTFYICTIEHVSEGYINLVNFSTLGSTEKNSWDSWTPFMYTISIERLEGLRYGNKSAVRMEIRYGKDASLFYPTTIYVDYLKSPQFIRLTQEQIDEVTDTSQLFEFPDYVCQEITNELTKLLLESSSDPRLQTNIPINQTISGQQQQR